MRTRKQIDLLIGGNMEEFYQSCHICPRNCKVNRFDGKKGICNVPSDLFVSRASLHMWEEPCISGTKGSGTVFFSGCNLHCIFCQNSEISGVDPLGKKITVEHLSAIFSDLQRKGANNINLVTPSHYIPSIAKALIMSKENELTIPVVYNSSGYDSVESLKMLEGLVDIWLPDFKYVNSEPALSFSNASDYPEIAKKALQEMVRQSPVPIFDEETGLLKKGVIVRHLVLPGHTKESLQVLDYLYNTYKDSIYISIMNQYTPFFDLLDKNKAPKELYRKVTKREYEKVVDYAINLGIKNGFTQEGKAASESFVPDFGSYEGI